MKYFVGLGSNLGDRKKSLQATLVMLEQQFHQVKCSMCVETPALLPENAPPEWNRAFLNTVVSLQSNEGPDRVLKALKEIELKSGRGLKDPRWSPRTIDCDLLFCDETSIDNSELRLPHKELFNRYFALMPLAWLDPKFIQHARKLNSFQPWVMGIVNLTPDSFSDGGEVHKVDQFLKLYEDWSNQSVPLIDIGAESTRPAATSISANEEWERLKPFLTELKKIHFSQSLRPLMSLDTRYPETAERALDWGVDIINDVTGLTNPKMRAVMKTCRNKFISMHSLSIPADKTKVLDSTKNPLEELKAFFEFNLTQLEADGIDPSRVIFDPGIGFGKTLTQSQMIMQNLRTLIDQFPSHDFLVGHSRKSFLNGITDKKFADRDLETLGASFSLAQQKTSILRVHDPISHLRAFRGSAFATK
jgi:2-amino-4-hydroxy-6-hydroxymethyldihydropteridine diphosphokinase/dihydropteroate synthase